MNWSRAGLVVLAFLVGLIFGMLPGWSWAGHAEEFLPLDVNEDGSLSGTERKGIERYDADGDGKISLREFVAGRAADGALLPALRSSDPQARARSARHPLLLVVPAIACEGSPGDEREARRERTASGPCAGPAWPHLGRAGRSRHRLRARSRAH